MAYRPTSPTVPRRQVGRLLAELRSEAGRTREDAASALECHLSKISRIEGGESSPSASDLRTLLDLYQATGEQRAEIQDLARDARRRRPRTTYGKAVPSWFRRFLQLEEAASEIRTYDGELVTGLLQTPEYARALTTATPLHDPAEVEHLVAVRTARQARLTGESPPMLWAVMSEAAIRLTVGGSDVMRTQLGHLLDLARMPHVTIQIATFAGGPHAATGFPFALMTFPGDPTEVAYTEDVTSASYLDRPDDPQRQLYVTVWSHLTASALSPKDSLTLVDTARREL